MKVPTALGPFALLVLALPPACVAHQKIGHAQPSWFRSQQAPGGKADVDRTAHQRAKYAQMQKDLVALTKSINEYEWKHVDIMQKFSDRVMKSQEETMPLEDKRKQLQEQLQEFATKNEALQQEMESYEATRTEKVDAMHEASRRVKGRLYDCIESNKKKWAATNKPFWVTTTEPAGDEAEEGSAGAEGGEDGPAESSEEDALTEDGPAESSEEGEQTEDGPADSSEGDEQIQAAPHPQGHNAEEPEAEVSAGPVAGNWGMPMGHPGMPMGHPGMFQVPRQPQRSRPVKAPSTTPLLVSTTDPVPVQGVRPDVLQKTNERGAVAHQKSWEGVEEEVEPQPQGCSSMESLAKKLQQSIEKYTKSKEQLMKDYAQQVKRKSLLELEGRSVDEVIENLRTDIGTLEHQGSATS